MAGIPNQSNINKTIKAQIGDINKVIECVVKASTSRTAILASNSLKDIKQGCPIAEYLIFLFICGIILMKYYGIMR